MVKRIGGSRRKTRHSFKKAEKDKGKLSLRKYFQKLENGQKVTLLADTAIQNGLYHKRFHGKVGEIKGKKGICYEVEVADLQKKKILNIHPVHLRAMK